MKQKCLKTLIVILAFTLVFFNTCLVFAEDETVNVPETVISENPNAENASTNDILISPNDITDPAEVISSESTLKEYDVYLTGDNIVVDYIVDGNLFIKANTVTINSEIGGDAFIVADNVIIGEDAYIFSNLFAVANNVLVQGVVYDVYALTNYINISGYVYRDVKTAALSGVNITGTVGRNAFIAGTSNISFTDPFGETTTQGSVTNNLTYYATKEANISLDNVSGTITFIKVAATSLTQNSIATYLLGLGAILVLVIVLWLLVNKLSPKFADEITDLVKSNPLPIIIASILGITLLPIISVILLLLGITSLVGILLAILYIALLILSLPAFILTVNCFVTEKLHIEKTSQKIGFLILTGIILCLLGLIPVVGTFLTVIMVILGFGVLPVCIFKKNKKDTK